MPDILGPASTNAVTMRPPRTIVRGANDTWYKDCTSPTAQDGTKFTADFFNDILAQFRTAFAASGITLDNADDMLWRAIQSVSPSIFITANVTLYVGTVPGDYASIDAAMAYLKNKLIVSGATVTIVLRAGVHVYAAPIILDHPTLNRIRIVGATMAGAVPVPGDFVCTGSGSVARASDYATNLAMLRTRFGTELRFTGATGGIVAAPGQSLQSITNTLLVCTHATPTGAGLSVAAADITVNTVAICGFNHNWYVTNSGGSVRGSNVYGCGGLSSNFYIYSVASLDVTGVFVSAQTAGTGLSVIEAFATIASSTGAPTAMGSAYYNVQLSWSASVHIADGLKAAYSGSYGVFSAHNASIYMPASIVNNSGADNLFASTGAKIIAESSNVSAAGGGGSDYKAAHGSFIYASGYINGASTFSPALNTIGNANSYIEA